MVVVTFASYLRKAGPFFVDSLGLSELVSSHARLCDDSFFSGDVTILDPQHRRVVVVHHDGLVADVRRPPSPSTTA